jgi:hypothetical protein
MGLSISNFSRCLGFDLVTTPKEWGLHRPYAPSIDCEHFLRQRPEDTLRALFLRTGIAAPSMKAAGCRGRRSHH